MKFTVSSFSKAKFLSAVTNILHGVYLESGRILLNFSDLTISLEYYLLLIQLATLKINIFLQYNLIK